MSSTTTLPRPEPTATWKLLLVEAFLAILLITETTVLVFTMVLLWPNAHPTTADQAAPAVSSGAAALEQTLATGNILSPETEILLLVMTCGGLGATLHAIYSFCDFVGNRRFQLSWTVWYLGRLPIGMAVACVLYLTLRGGFTGFGNDAAGLNLYGVAGLAALTGMFSRQAVTKLSEIANTIFTKLPPQPDALQNPRATLVAIKPATITAGSTAVTILLEGKDFVHGMRAVVDHMLCETTWKSPTEAEVVLCDKLVDDPTTLTVAVRNPDPCPGESETRDLAVIPAGPVPPAVASP